MAKQSYDYVQPKDVKGKIFLTCFPGRNGEKISFEEDIFLEEGYPVQNPKSVLTKVLTIPMAPQSAKVEESIYKRFLFFYRYNWVAFIESFFDEVLQINPAPVVVRAIGRTYLKIDKKGKYHKLIEQFPEYFSDSGKPGKMNSRIHQQ